MDAPGGKARSAATRERAARLAAALKANVARRKAQAKARDSGEAEAPAPDADGSRAGGERKDG